VIEPGSSEWFEARCGRVGASRVYDATARGKNGKYYAARADYLAELAVERLTGIPTTHYVTPAMMHGIEQEPNARAAYEYLFSVDVEPVGFVQHETHFMSGATPDGRVTGTNVLCEFKCPTSATHIETLLTKEIDPRYIAQMDWQLACCPWAEAVDFSTYDPRMPPELRLWTLRYMRDDARIAALEAEVGAFLAELDDMVAKLRAAGRLEKAA
jgi:hypothetical protein